MERISLHTKDIRTPCKKRNNQITIKNIKKKQENTVREKCKKERMTRTQSERKWHERKGESKKKIFRVEET